MILYVILALAATALGLISPPIDATVCTNPLVKDEVICVQIETDSEKIKSAIALLDRVRGFVVPGGDVPVVLEPMDGVLLDAFIDMYTDSPNPEMEYRIASFATTCSSGFFEAVFARFVDRLHVSVTDRLAQVVALVTQREEAASKLLRKSEKKARQMKDKEDKLAAQREAEAVARRERDETAAMAREETAQRRVLQAERAAAVRSDEEDSRRKAAEAKEAEAIKAAALEAAKKDKQVRKELARLAAAEAVRERAEAEKTRIAEAAAERSRQVVKLRNEYFAVKGNIEIDRTRKQLAETELARHERDLDETSKRLADRFAPLLRAMEKIDDQASEDAALNAGQRALQTSLSDLVDELSGCLDSEVNGIRGRVVSILVEMKRAGMSADQMWAVCYSAYADMDASPILGEIEYDIQSSENELNIIKRRMRENEARAKSLLEQLGSQTSL